jgi:hypothetical protein
MTLMMQPKLIRLNSLLMCVLTSPVMAQTLPDAHYVEIPGTHMGSVTQKELGQAMVDFLSA